MIDPLLLFFLSFISFALGLWFLFHDLAKPSGRYHLMDYIRSYTTILIGMVLLIKFFLNL